MRRRDFVVTAAAVPLANAQSGRKRIACLSSTYHVRSHSDNFITRFLEGYWIHEKYYEPPFEVASLWMDQVHAADIGQRLAERTTCEPRKRSPMRSPWEVENSPWTEWSWFASTATIRITKNSSNCTRATSSLSRWSKYSKTADAPARCSSDKHLSYDWRKAKQMYDWSRELKFPFMAGSSVPVTFRRPEYDPPLGIEMETALSVGGGWVADGGIFHILDTLQAFVERRKGGETGVRAVQMLKGDEVWKAAQQGLWRRDLLDAALARREKVRSGKRPEDMRAVLGLIEYRDGFRGAVLALDEVSEYLVAVKPKGKQPEATLVLHTDREFEQFLDAGTRHHADDRNRKRAVRSRAHITGHRRVGSIDGFGLPERQEVGDTGTDGRVQGPCP